MELKKALDKCMYICSQREYCIHDIEEKLTKWEVNIIVHQEIIKTLLAEKYIDHKRYVPAFINDKFTFNHWGKIKIRYHLKQKRIEDALIKTYLDAIDNQSYNEVIQEEINKKKRMVKGANEFDRKQKIARYVISKGFEPNIVFEKMKME
jgi:regulatory protein